MYPAIVTAVVWNDPTLVGESDETRARGLKLYGIDDAVNETPPSMLTATRTLRVVFTAGDRQRTSVELNRVPEMITDAARVELLKRHAIAASDPPKPSPRRVIGVSPRSAPLLGLSAVIVGSERRLNDPPANREV